MIAKINGKNRVGPYFGQINLSTRTELPPVKVGVINHILSEKKKLMMLMQYVRYVTNTHVIFFTNFDTRDFK